MFILFFDLVLATALVFFNFTLLNQFQDSWSIRDISFQSVLWKDYNEYYSNIWKDGWNIEYVFKFDDLSLLDCDNIEVLRDDIICNNIDNTVKINISQKWNLLIKTTTKSQ
jgi:hypothetical protein